MRILFDRNVPTRVRELLLKHETRTISQMGWSPRISNGELLNAAEASGFDILVTCDHNIPYQQNLGGRKLALVIHSSNLWPSVQACGPEISATVENAALGNTYRVAIPLPPLSRKKRPRE